MSIRNISLYFKEGKSDKEYHVQLEKVKDSYVVNFQYGRRGNALQSGTKTLVPVSLGAAQQIYDKLVREKTSKGYSEGEKKKSFDGEVEFKLPSKEVYILPQLLNDIDNPQYYIDNDDYLAQEKKNGERRMLVADERMFGLNKKGQEVQLPISIVKSNSNICTLDGEIIGEKLFVFDILSYNGKSTKEMACMSRVAMLNALDFGYGIEVVKTANSKKEKQKLYDKLIKDNAEGIVFKRKDSTYKHGRPASGGDHLKHKFYKEATFIVANLTKGKRSVGLEVIGQDGESRVFMGKVTIPPNKAIPSVGDFVEVRYLYAYKDGAVYQPTYKEKRNDCDLTDATIKQIVYKQEQEVF